MAPMQTRILTLNKGEHQERVLYRLEKGWALRFVLGPNLMGHKVRLFANHPPQQPMNAEEAKTMRFVRGEFHEIPWSQGSKLKHDEMDRYAEIKLCLAGPFSYFYLVDSDDIDKPNGSGYFQVQPGLTVGPEDEPLYLDGIQCQTVVAKLLGPFPTWEGRLRVSMESGYNMVHLTPTQELGISNSAYSLNDQLTLSSAYSTPEKKYTFDDLKALVQKMKNEWKLLTVSDVVWNHTAKSSPWLKEHPECGYNLKNSPHLRPAFLLDRALFHFGQQVAQNRWEHRGLPAGICEEHHLDALRATLQEEVIPNLKLHEFFQVDVDAVTKKFAQELEGLNDAYVEKPDKPSLQYSDVCLTIVQDPEYRRFGSTVNNALALMIYNKRRESGEVERKQQCVHEFRQKLVELNNEAAGRTWEHMCVAINAIIGHVRYERVVGHGPRYNDYSEHHPLVTSYFKYDVDGSDLSMDEQFMHSNGNEHAMAFNGWVMNDDPLNNFAEPHSMVYFRRELICWGDSVKLRYGEKPEDCPYLWDRMTKYSQLSAEVFHGVRIDNCHSTPIHVAEYFLDEARKVRPELYVIAELFTKSEDIDNIFVNRLGITSLIREAQAAWDAHEEGRLVYRYGGDPVGSFIQPPVRPLAPTIAHAIFHDLTHDNQCPVQTRTVFDLFPTAAIISMAACATGSSRGYDELVPYHVHVVNEKRLHSSWTDSEDDGWDEGAGLVNMQSGIIAGKRALNKLHYELSVNGFSEAFVDQVAEDVVAVTRHNPTSHQSVILVARTCFKPEQVGRTSHVKPLRVAGTVDDIIFEARLVVEPRSSKSPKDISRPKASKKWPGAEKYILGTPDYFLDIKEHVSLVNSEMIDINHEANGREQEIEFSGFPPGAVVAIRVNMFQDSRQAVLNLRQGLMQFGYRLRSLSGTNLKSPSPSSSTTQLWQGDDLRSIAGRMTLQDMNTALFRCNEEEEDDGLGGGSYNVPNLGSFVYCGLQGVVVYLTDIRQKNDLGHPLCHNIRFGNWLVEYYGKRLLNHPGTKELGNWFMAICERYYLIPHYLRPCYFDALITGVYNVLRDAAWHKMSGFVQEGSFFVRSLALNTVSFCAYSKNADLPKLSDKVSEPGPPTKLIGETGQRDQACTTISAGLPHFARGLFRNWGRDTFIALPGVMLVPGRFDEARYIILAFAGTLRHGLIPNLLGGGAFARYNCRDAVWWWLHAIKCYYEAAGEEAGQNLLNDTVRRLYPNDDAVAGQEDKDEPLHVTMQEALQRHFQGIDYIERNAGYQIDEHMRQEGFHVTAGICKETGFVFGGNEWNCGTWMDKMGSSDRAGNRGRPATPRDGSAVELVGLSATVVQWLAKMSADGKYSHGGVSCVDDEGKQIGWKWSDWYKKIKDNFEKHFYVDPSVHDSKSDEAKKPGSEAKFVNRKGIYKDSYMATQRWSDYQLRPNAPIALAVATDLITPEKAWNALELTEKALKGPLGMKTLDPSDWAYDGFYDNSDDSSNAGRAKGFNYHQGPEWVWVMGYFLRAKLAVAWRLKSSKPEIWTQAIASVQQTLSNHLMHMQSSPWRSLPELTNKDGVFCPGSCPAQAWSVGCILEVMHDLNNYESAA